MSLYIKHSILGLFLASLITPLSAIDHRAVVIVPVADLLGQPQSTQAIPASLAYKNIPLFGGKNRYVMCPRMHQLLYNEVVEVVEERGDECLIRLPAVFYITATTTTPQRQYWTLKSNLLKFAHFKRHSILPSVIPAAATSSPHQPKTVTLTSPWKDPRTNRTFSAGTRFVRTPESKTTTYHVYSIDPQTLRVHTLSIPASYCYDPARTQDKRAAFIKILRDWATPPHGFIPYVWGGTSFTTLCHDQSFTEVETPQGSYYAFPNYPLEPKTGFDCSGIILRAADIVGIPYYCKNTYTIGATLPHLQKHDVLENGDLILIFGHVMIVSDVQKGLLIEARAHHHGYGKVHEIHLKDVFKGIHTYQELVHAYHKRLPLERFDKDGTLRDTFTSWAIIKLPIPN
ncbi:MAG TPA: hypothetical protein VLG71_02055 [Candidatus Limnocylindria bacterium]|nr:hypothetical protein [Candidatus Limnocylindria bacterium]